MARSLLTALILLTPLACSRAPATTDCPPAATTPATSPSADASSPAANELAAAPLGPAEPLTATADDGHAIRVWTLAPPAGPTGDAADRPAIVLVHGRTWSSIPDFDLRVGDDTSLSLMRRLADRGFVSYAVDLRGYGQTERDASGWLTPDRAAADLAAVLAFVREREGEAPAVLGWSFGALVAQLAVQRQPEAARALILYGYPRDPDQRAAEATSKDPPAKLANTEDAARSDFITPGTMSDAAITAYVQASLAADPVKADWTATDQFNALDPAAVRVPTLVIHGVADPIARSLWQAKLFTRLTVADRQWVIVPNADHAAHLEQPEEFVRALLSFLDRGPA